MKIKIEKKNLTDVGVYHNLTPVYEALRDMKVGESFVLEANQITSIRSVLTACKTLIGSHFAVRKEGKIFRIGRVK